MFFMVRDLASGVVKPLSGEDFGFEISVTNGHSENQANRN
jgi:hypothetical protein